MLNLVALITQLATQVERHRITTGQSPDVLWVTPDEAQLLALSDYVGPEGTFNGVRLAVARPLAVSVDPRA